MALTTLLRKKPKQSKEDGELVNYLADLEKEAKEGKLYLALTSAKLALNRAKELNLDIGIEVEDFVYDARKNYLPKLYEDTWNCLHKLDSSDKYYSDDILFVELKILRLARLADLIGKSKQYSKRIDELYELLEEH